MTNRRFLNGEPYIESPNVGLVEDEVVSLAISRHGALLCKHKPIASYQCPIVCGFVGLCLILGMLMLCSSCVSISNKGTIKMYPSPNFNERKCPVSMIILHYTVIPTCEESLMRLSETTNEAGNVSAHYLVDRDGCIYNLVDESKRAWHAGLGSWAGLNDINSRSIGIEIVNAGLTADGKREPFPAAQIDAVIKLCKDIQSRYTIKYVLGHSDVAPQRKQDPGEAFPWRTLAAAGVGVWTDDFMEPKKPADEMLGGIGYDVSDVDKAIIAFQRHWYPEAITIGALNTIERIAAVYSLITKK